MVATSPSVGTSRCASFASARALAVAPFCAAQVCFDSFDAQLRQLILSDLKPASGHLAITFNLTKQRKHPQRGWHAHLVQTGWQANWLNASSGLILAPLRTGVMMPPVRPNATAEAANFENAKSGPLQDRRFALGCGVAVLK